MLSKELWSDIRRRSGNRVSWILKAGATNPPVHTCAGQEQSPLNAGATNPPTHIRAGQEQILNAGATNPPVHIRAGQEQSPLNAGATNPPTHICARQEQSPFICAPNLRRQFLPGIC